MTEENKKTKVAVLTCGDSAALMIKEKIKDLGYEVVNVTELPKDPIDELAANLNKYIDNNSYTDKPSNNCWWQRFEKKKNRKSRY